ncbi:hypothetical protein [Teredinibacter haidensis]|mgnify:CR=1 FL=1|uniref:hypothetical protein n=1 Tax=Teredinibacter haidensis TaxID=2731755 RepID=UPI000B16821C|nr:hypothetical protein [Teredinibacter haidensis]
MKTYCTIIAAAIVLVFASVANAAPDNGREHRSSNEQRGQSHRQDKAPGAVQHKPHHRVERHVEQHRRRDLAHAKRDSHRREVHRQHLDRKYSRAYRHNDHRNHHKSHNRVIWNVNLDLSPSYQNRTWIYFQRDYNGQCFRVEERPDREVWIEVPHYKCS